jgi:hypothetical protein
MLTDVLYDLLQEYKDKYIELTISCNDGFMRMGRIKCFDDIWITLIYISNENNSTKIIEQTFLMANILVIRTEGTLNLEEEASST